MTQKIKFYKTSSPKKVADYLADSVKKRLLEGRKVLWLVPGGSAIKIATLASKQLSGIDLTNLTISLTDERFGPAGHKDSNWQQLKKAGFYLPGAKLIPVLNGGDIKSTTSDFAFHLSSAIDSADYKIGFFGMGSDGHTAGILPGSTVVDSLELAASFIANDYQRITITPATILLLDEAILYAAGHSKYQAIDDLEKEIPVKDQPAQILKSVNEFIVYNDYKGGEAI